jgi:hypothetical protein
MFRVVEYIPSACNVDERVVKVIKKTGDSKADYLSAVAILNKKPFTKRKHYGIQMSCDGKEWFALA